MARRTGMLMAAVAATTVVGAAAWGMIDLTKRGDDRTACPSIVDFEGRRYVGWGENRRTPALGGEIGTGEFIACGDGGGNSSASAFPIHSIEGVPRETAVYGGGGVLLSEGSAPPESVRALSRFYPCTAQGRMTLTGDLETISASGFPAPYLLSMRMDRDGGLEVEGYESVEIRVAVTERTRGGDDQDLILGSVQGDDRVEVNVVCGDKRDFVASTIRRPQ